MSASDLIRDRGKAKAKFTRKCTLFQELVTNEEPLPILEAAYQEIVQAFVNLEMLCDELIARIDDEKTSGYEAVLRTATTYIEDAEKKKIAMSKQLIQKKTTHDLNTTSKINVKKLDPPGFGGKHREYANFINDFTRIVIPKYGKDCYALRQCLSGDALKHIAGCEDNYDEMMSRLDRQYGDPRKLVDLVISELKAIKQLSDGDHTGFIEMVYVIETGHLDLKKLNLEDEMNSTSIVSLIERVLPPTQKREWVLIAGTIENKSALFPFLLEYLLRERSALEYMESDIRKVTKSTHSTVTTPSKENLVEVVRQLKSDQENTNKLLSTIYDKVSNNVASVHILKCFVHNSNDHSITECKTFKTMNNKAKLDEVKWKGACYKCLMPSHISRYCTSNIQCNTKGNDGAPCQRPHHPLLHDSFLSMTPYNYTSSCQGDKALLSVSSVNSLGFKLTVLWDSGSDVSLITHKMANKLQLKGSKINLSVVKVGNVRQNIVTKEYMIQLKDIEGKLYNINVIGMNEITDVIRKVDLSNLNCIFPTINVNEVSRPHGSVDVLIGLDNADILPQVVKTSGKFQLLKNAFGYSVRGMHPMLQEGDSGGSCVGSHAMAKVNHININFKNDQLSINDIDLKEQLDKFFVVENSGIECKENCPKCLCRSCPKQNHSMKEERELKLIEEGLKYNTSTESWTVSYPWLVNPNQLPNNYNAAFARLRGLEAHLRKRGQIYIDMYQNEVNDMQMRLASRKLNLNEVQSYRGPVQYIPHHEILKPDSKSTPLRIVFDSSMKCKGYRLNDLWAKGPNVLASLLGVLLRFRADFVGVIGDISKMYNAISLSPLDMHVHRWLWRGMNQNSPPDHYALTRLPFGDRPSGVIATIALRKTAEMYKDEFPAVDHVINNNTYMDDLLFSVDTIEKADRLIHDIEAVLSHGNFFIKHWIVSGQFKSDVINILDTDTEKVLGMRLDTKSDCFVFKVRINFSTKIKKLRSGPDMTKFECIDKFPSVLTRRMVLSQIATIYDPMGLVLPITLKAKLLMRELIKENKNTSNNCKINWDGPLSPAVCNVWKEFFISLYDIEDLTFKRCFKPIGAIGNPNLVLFSDASQYAYGAVAYGVFQLASGCYEANLLAAKNRIAPKLQQTMPRLELNGAVLSSRLRETIVRELEWEFDLIFHIVDSMIVRSQIQRDSYDFKTFVATRVSEIQSQTEGSEWYWVDGKLNPADMLTRPCKPEALISNSFWQKGPKFLSLPHELWPISQTQVAELPDKIASVSICVTSKFNFDDFDISRFSKYQKLLRVTCRVLRLFECKSIHGILKEPSAQNVIDIELLWIRYVQSNLLDWEIKYARLGPFIKNRIVYVGARIANWLKDNYNQDSYILLPRNHPFTTLYITNLHYQTHEGVETTLAKLQTRFWVPSARKIIKNIKAKCVVCRKLERKIDHQSMGQKLDKQMKPSPAFYHCAVDLFGPFEIKDTVRRRVRAKCFGVIFSCFTTRAVYLDLTEGYSTNEFLNTFRRFVCIRGYPATIHSDNGTQLVSANKQLRDIAKGLDLDRIKELGTSKGIQWSFNKSSDSPWYNASCESLIRLVKGGLVKSIGESVFTFSELQTVLFEVSNLMNGRPIGVKPGMDIEKSGYLSPNDLLLGHSNIAVPTGAFSNIENPKRRLEFIQCVVNNFWKRWMRDYFGSLLIRQKWHVKKRNVQPRDIVLIQDSNTIRGRWKIAEVTKIEKGRDAVVRDVRLRYKIVDHDKPYTGSKDKTVVKSVHRLVVILPANER